MKIRNPELVDEELKTILEHWSKQDSPLIVMWPMLALFWKWIR